MPGDLYNIGGHEYRSVKDLSNVILKYLGLEDSFVEYLPEDKHNTQNKRPDITRACQLLSHDPKITLEEGVPKTIEWMRQVYADTVKH